MRMRRFLVVALAVFPWIPLIPDAVARDLTFEERVKAQEAIERVHYAHLIGATKPFEVAVPRALLETKVRTYLEESAILETYWKTPITAQALTREWERMARNTRLPDRLREIEAALGNDRRLILEGLARPALADRLARDFFNFDRRIHDAPRRKAEEMRSALASGAILINSDHPLRTVSRFVRAASAQRLPIGEAIPAGAEDLIGTGRIALEPGRYSRTRATAPAEVGAIGAVSEDPEAFVIRVVIEETPESFSLATYAVPKIGWEEWRARSAPAIDPAAAIPVAAPDAHPRAPRSPREPVTLPGVAANAASSCGSGDAWDNGSLADLPDSRVYHTAVWTGTEMIVWGGIGGGADTRSGGRYDPATDTWSPTSTTNAPEGRARHTAVWTGTEMIVWGGCAPAGNCYMDSGGRYDPVTDSWSPTSTTDAPVGRYLHTAVWTGTEMIVWGGILASSPALASTGGRYDPATDTWSPTSIVNAPGARAEHLAVWTGARMIIWGGNGPGAFSGGRYDPGTDTWDPISTVNAPIASLANTAVWTGTKMIVWGGTTGVDLNSGGQYDPIADTWTPMSTINAPAGRAYHSAVWTGTEMIVWGGRRGSPSLDLDTGGRYNPATDTWAPTAATDALAARSEHSAVWTGTLMIVWGGHGPVSLNAGGRYDPATDTWSPSRPTSTTDAPVGRTFHTAVWTGNEMIVWGGFGFTSLNSGGRYDPATDTWVPTSTINVPDGRHSHTAVWTGSRMIVWGGIGIPTAGDLNTGGRYDPITDTWEPTSTTNAPAWRYGHTSVWTGTRMIVWGGFGPGLSARSGGLYDPITDTWAPTSTDNAPAATFGQPAVWTGTEMIVWGGFVDNAYTNTGARYDPATDTWTPTSIADAPEARDRHTVVWTGTEMIVWGGFGPGLSTRSGGRYDPVTDTWTPTSTTDSPEGRSDHTAIWTGTEMIVWGGWGYAPLDTGGRYRPATDTWSPTSTTNAAAGRLLHTAIWTGTEMIVWGGDAGGGDYLNTGGRYRPGTTSDPPTADAGPDLVVECAGPSGTVVQLNGVATGCGPLTYRWTGPFAEGRGSVQGSEAAVTVPLGQSTITLKVTDAQGRTAGDTVVVTVRDTTPPTITVLADPPSLWPPNNKMVPVNVLARVRDVCDPKPALALVSVSSSGPDGATSDDIQGADLGTPDTAILLRATGDGGRSDRVYTLTYQARDGSGNTARGLATVTVDHRDDQPNPGLQPAGTPPG